MLCGEEAPDIRIGNPHNDYGQGFYCTKEDEMACEWACKKNTDGFVNVYDFDDEGLNILNLPDGQHTVLHWIALLLRYRTFKLETELSADARDYIIEHYLVDKNIYYPKLLDRDTKARETYRKEIKKTKSYRDDIFVLDILREEMKGDDPRIQRILFE